MSSKYAAAHASPNGPGDARPTALQIIQDEGLEGKLSDKVVLITGCTAGIGIETARALAATGAKVFCTVRNLSRIPSSLSSVPNIEFLELDQSSFKRVRDCVANFLSKSKKLNLLICNAGVMNCPEGKTEDGFETHMGVNHLSHFLLFQLLKQTMLDSATAEFGSRVVMVSSVGHRLVPLTTATIPLVEEEGEYNGFHAYSRSKLANVWMGNEIERRYGANGLHGLSLHPGAIMQTGLGKYTDDAQKALWAMDPKIPKLDKSSEQGAATSVWAAVAKELEGKGGKYLEDCQESAAPLPEGAYYLDPGYAAWTYQPEGEKKLWIDSLKAVGMEDEN